MAKKRKLRTVADVVEALGGTKAAAEWADVGMSAVSNWIERSLIPPGWHYRLDKELGAQGFEIDPAVFGFVEEKERPARPQRAEKRVA